jgi:hypothetical protein
MTFNLYVRGYWLGNARDFGDKQWLRTAAGTIGGSPTINVTAGEIEGPDIAK